MAGQKEQQSEPIIKTACLVYVADGALTHEGRPDAEEAWVLHWADEGVVIPWLAGRSIHGSIIDWAWNQLRTRGVWEPLGPAQEVE